MAIRCLDCGGPLEPEGPEAFRCRDCEAVEEPFYSHHVEDDPDDLQRCAECGQPYSRHSPGVCHACAMGLRDPSDYARGYAP